MKRLYILLILLILPLMVNAETLTYDVCDTCEYKNALSATFGIVDISFIILIQKLVNFYIKNYFFALLTKNYGPNNRSRKYKFINSVSFSF